LGSALVHQINPLQLKKKIICDLSLFVWDLNDLFLFLITINTQPLETFSVRKTSTVKEHIDINKTV